MKNIIVVDKKKDWAANIPEAETITAKQFLQDPAWAEKPHTRVYNLCRSYRYQSIGYYVSLLAEARGQKVIPDVSTIQDFKTQTIARIFSDEIDTLIQKKLSKLKSSPFTLSIYFGKNLSAQYDQLTTKLFTMFQAPLMRAVFTKNSKWSLQSISPITTRDVPEIHLPYLEQFCREHFAKKSIRRRKKSSVLYDLAILHNPNEPHPPSDPKALKRFIQAAESTGFYVDLITRDDVSSIAEYDALFIRETTSVNHHTYRIARRAQAEDLVVIDDPESILKCANKVYLAELMTRAKIPTPKTLVVSKDNVNDVEAALGLPCVLKQPDSSFSQGVVRVDDTKSLKIEIEKLLTKSELVLAQQYSPTEFDWRVGVLDGKALYACKYYMSKGHWQIYNWQEEKNNSGKFETLPVEIVPDKIIQLAIKSANLIGKGFYGVDIKQAGKELMVIEVNDNPSIDSGVEDKVLKEHLYLSIARSFLRRLEQKRNRL